MSKNGSLKKWNESGLLSRELAPYFKLAEEFKEIYIFSYGQAEDKKYQKILPQNIKILTRPFFLPFRFYKYLGPIWHFKSILKANILKTNQMRGAETALFAKTLNPKAKLVIRTGYTQSLFDSQAGQLNPYTLKLEAKAYQKCDLALVTSQGDREYLIKKYKISENKIKIIANYIDTDIFKPLPEISKYQDHLVFVGRVGDLQKNILNLLEALSGTGLTLDIIGSSKNNEKIARKAEIENISVNFLGNLPNEELSQVLNRYPIFILPSLYEGMPKSLLEAMACGLAVIATDVPGSREIVKPNQTGLLSDTSPESLEKNISRLFTDKDLRIKLGQAARNFVIQNFSLSTEIQKEISLYSKLIS